MQPGLARTDDPKLAEILLADWKAYSPSLRSAIPEIVLSRPAWTASLHSCPEDGCVPLAEIDPARGQQLLKRRNARLRSRALKPRDLADLIAFLASAGSAKKPE